MLVPRTVPVTSIGCLSVPSESRVDSDLTFASSTCFGTGVAGFSFSLAAAACSSSAFGTGCSPSSAGLASTVLSSSFSLAALCRTAACRLPALNGASSVAAVGARRL